MFHERVCVSTDGSDLAVRAAQMGAVLAHAGAGRMVAVSVAQAEVSAPGNGAATPAAQARLARAEQAARAHVANVERIARSAGVSCDTATPVAPAPGPAILQAAADHGCDLIVMGTHGPHDANPLFTGSNAQYVLANSTIPVLLLRDPRDASQPEFVEDAPA